MVELNIYEIENKLTKNGDPFFLLETDLGSVYCFSNDFEGDFERVKDLKGHKIDGGVTVGDFQKLKVVNSIIGIADERKKPKDKDRMISRIACVNSAIKMIEASSDDISLKEINNKIKPLAEGIFEFINK